MVEQEQEQAVPTPPPTVADVEPPPGNPWELQSRGTFPGSFHTGSSSETLTPVESASMQVRVDPQSMHWDSEEEEEEEDSEEDPEEDSDEEEEDSGLFDLSPSNLFQVSIHNLQVLPSSPTANIRRICRSPSQSPCLSNRQISARSKESITSNNYPQVSSLSLLTEDDADDDQNQDHRHHPEEISSLSSLSLSCSSLMTDADCDQEEEEEEEDIIETDHDDADNYDDKKQTCSKVNSWSSDIEDSSSWFSSRISASSSSSSTKEWPTDLDCVSSRISNHTEENRSWTTTGSFINSRIGSYNSSSSCPDSSLENQDTPTSSWD